MLTSLRDIRRGCRLTSWQFCADPRVAVASMSALAASQPPALNSSTSLRQDPDSLASPMDMESALAELGTLRAEMAALQAALTVLKGIRHSPNQHDCNRALMVHVCPLRHIMMCTQSRSSNIPKAADPLQVAYANTSRASPVNSCRTSSACSWVSTGCLVWY